MDFRDRTLILVKKLVKQHFNFYRLCHTFNKFASRYAYLLKKYKEFKVYDLSILFTHVLIVSTVNQKTIHTGLFIICYAMQENTWPLQEISLMVWK